MRFVRVQSRVQFRKRLSCVGHGNDTHAVSMCDSAQCARCMSQAEPLWAEALLRPVHSHPLLYGPPCGPRSAPSCTRQLIATCTYGQVWQVQVVGGECGTARRRLATDGITLQGLEPCRCEQPLDMHREQQGPFRELNPGPRAPEARIMPLDQTAN